MYGQIISAYPTNIEQTTNSSTFPDTSSNPSSDQLDISGGSVVYDDSDSKIVTKHDANPVVYEVVPKFIDGWISSPSSLTVTIKGLVIEEPLADLSSAEEDPMEVAETQVFRPLFRYRAVQEVKKRQPVTI